MSKDYKAESIQVLESIQAVRLRPGMYIGSTGPEGLLQLIYEVVANAVDEALAGYANYIEVRLLKDNYILVKDNGRGIPVDIHPNTKKSALETVLTYLHAGGKFDKKIYKVSGGLHGVGISVVNALSEHLKAQVAREGYLWEQQYQQGKPLGPVKKLKQTKETGTTIVFKPDPEIFSTLQVDRRKLIQYLREQAYLTPNLTIKFFDEQKDKLFAYGFRFEGGVKSFLKFLTAGKRTLLREPFYFRKEKDNCILEIAFSYVDETNSLELAFTNNILNQVGGTHLTGFNSALTKIFNHYARANGFLKEKDENFTGEDVREGIVAIISLKHPDPQFEGQTKQKLGNPEVKPLVEKLTAQALKEYLETHPQEAKILIQKISLAAQARKAAKSAKEAVLRKSALTGFTLPGKLADCSTKNPEIAELFIVEGDSAGGSAKQARDRKIQAILPLRGKILNVEKARLDKILKSEEIRNLIIALGTSIGQDFDIRKLRYHKIIIATDADSDGNHIRTLLLTLFYRHFRPIIEKGYLYLAQPPLYKIQTGKEKIYLYSDEEKDKIIKELKMKKKNFEVQRYKGLGEMNPEELWETTLNPEKRIIKQVTIEDAENADRLFSILMGEEVEPRKKFIEAYAREVKNLDI